VDDVVFCGDMVVEGVTPHLAPESIHPFAGLDHYLQSLSHLQSWASSARLVLNGHDEAITDLPTQIELTRTNILRRMRKAVQVLGEPLTIEQVCTGVYGETGGYNKLLVIEKTGAYVEYLYERGLIEIVNPNELEQAQPAKYRLLQEAPVIWDVLAKNLGVYTGTQVNT
jgi:glyoxylase-like metal-dependent hydrolase (beta-lactamase superfamily II)